MVESDNIREREIKMTLQHKRLLWSYRSSRKVCLYNCKSFLLLWRKHFILLTTTMLEVMKKSRNWYESIEWSDIDCFGV